MTLFASPTKTDLGEPYLKLQVGRKNQIALPMKYAQEVLAIPNQRLTAIPNMPPHVVGLLHQRSQVFWVIDLSLLLGLDFNAKGLREYNVAVIRVDNIPLGLVVQKIKGVIKINPEKIQSPIGTVSSSLIRYLSGCILDTNDLILILDPTTIVS